MSNETSASDDGSVVICEAGDCGREDCEKCRDNLTTEAKSMEDCMGRSMETLSQAFTASARRWEMIVYPSLFAFILLAGYGFYLIYSLTQDAHHMARNMQDISDNMVVISERMIAVSQNTDKQAAAMHEMVVNMHNMNVSMNQMRQDMSVMNYSVSRPMNKINSFMPW
jgi:methyl-accepting chemotaxis protein